MWSLNSLSLSLPLPVCFDSKWLTRANPIQTWRPFYELSRSKWQWSSSWAEPRRSGTNAMSSLFLQMVILCTSCLHSTIKPNINLSASIKIFDLLPCAACFSAGRCQTSNSASPLAQIKNLVSMGSADGAREEYLGWQFAFQTRWSLYNVFFFTAASLFPVVSKGFQWMIHKNDQLHSFGLVQRTIITHDILIIMNIQASCHWTRTRL